ncbi:MAG: FAD-dependent oxidoreductase [gamma proteobacterium symbiont of Taylorina sp.]|nr:FAD-dependent oxidoreductase [gamma proteobacterium symbiont of Taylorina sp.]
MIADNQVDIAIIGGGIAGLWTLARLRQLGYQVILLEADELACQQTGASQGIIHGGTKYALTGKLTHSSQSIQKMPQRWKACLEGQGEIDLSQAKKLSDHQYLWSNKNLAARLTGFFASRVMSSRMKSLSSHEFAAPFDADDFNGVLYQLDEPVLDIQSVIESIRKQYETLIFQLNIDQISAADESYELKDSRQNIAISAQRLILTAGSGNEQLLDSLQLKQPEMQRRPLFMPMLKARASILPRIYAHCLGASALPKMTITAYTLPVSSSQAGEDEVVWYLGGEIAEKGVGRTLDEQISAAKQALQELMPWMNFSQCQWSALAIERAEPKMSDGSRPVEPAVFRKDNVITAWPVKLAMTPVMVDKIIEQLESAQRGQSRLIFEKKQSTLTPLISLLTPAHTAKLPWKKVQHWL